MYKHDINVNNVDKHAEHDNNHQVNANKNGNDGYRSDGDGTDKGGNVYSQAKNNNVNKDQIDYGLDSANCRDDSIIEENKSN